MSFFPFPEDGQFMTETDRTLGGFFGIYELGQSIIQCNGLMLTIYVLQYDKHCKQTKYFKIKISK